MRYIPTQSSLRDTTVATIRSARELLALLQSSTLDFGRDDREVTRFMDRLDKAVLFSEADDLIFVAITTHARAGIAARYPTWAEALAEGRVPEEPLGDPDAELARRLLDAVLDFRHLRQMVLDETLADRLLADLQRRR